MKMFINRPTIKTIVAAFAAALIIPSCAQLEETQGQGVGYLTISGLDVDVTVDMIMPTKSVSLPEISDPTDIICKVTDKNGNEYRSDSDSWKSPLVIPVGSYTLEAWSGENGFGAPYFYGKTTGTIGAENKTETVQLSVENSLVAVTVSSDLDGHFTPGSNVTLTSGSVSYTASLGSYCFVPSGAALTLSLAGKNSAANSAEFTYTLSSPAAKTAYEVICGKSSTNWPGISISSDLNEGAFEGGLYFAAASVSGAMSDENKADLVYQIKGGSYSDWTTVTPSEVSGYKYISGLANGTTYTLRACVGNITSAEYTFTPVTFDSCVTVSSSAAHTTNTAGELDGTAVSTSVTTDLPSIVASLASTTATGTFTNSADATRSSAASTSLNENGTTSLTMTNADGWPYIPQGSYKMTVNASCEIGGNTYTVSPTSDITVSAPEFELTLSSYTSYDKYAATNGHTKELTNSEGTGANDCNAETLYNAGGKWSISQAIMNNANYAKTLIIKVDGSSVGTYEVQAYDGNSFYQNVTSLSWASHSLDVSFTFDGVTVADSRTHYITGLPYSAPNFDTEGDAKWSIVSSGSKEYITFGDNVLLKTDGTAPSVSSPAFKLPADVDVSLYNKYTKNTGSLGKYTYSVSLYGSSGTGTSLISHKSNDEGSYEYNVNTTFTTSYNQLLFKYGYQALGNDVTINIVTLKYR